MRESCASLNLRLVQSRCWKKNYDAAAFFAVIYPSPPTSDALSTGALVGIAIGVGLFVLLILVVCCCLYRRQKKQINEYKQLYFLQQSDYKVLNAALFLLLFIGVLHIRELNQKREQMGDENRQSFSCSRHLIHIMSRTDP